MLRQALIPPAHAAAGYQTDRQPGDASQYTARCPGGPGALAATAGAQSHIDQDTVIRPGPHSCPFAQRSG